MRHSGSGRRGASGLAGWLLAASSAILGAGSIEMGREVDMSNAEPLKQRIRNGETLSALRVPMTVAQDDLTRALSSGEYDYVYIDGQHQAFTDQQIVSIASVAEDLGYQVQFRIPHTRLTYLIGRYLDLGVSGILVPEVMDEASVDEAIEYAYYPPFGKRSWGGESRYGLSALGDQFNRLSYAEWWNDRVVLALQIESVEAVVNARQLARSGVDYLAFGPMDLAFSIDAHPEFPLRSTRECVRHVLDQLQDTGVQVGIATTIAAEERAWYEEQGVTLFQEPPGL